MYSEQKAKDAIVQELVDALESEDWGGKHDRTIIKVILKGRLNMMPIEIDAKRTSGRRES